MYHFPLMSSQLPEQHCNSDSHQKWVQQITPFLSWRSLFLSFSFQQSNLHTFSYTATSTLDSDRNLCWSKGVNWDGKIMGLRKNVGSKNTATMKPPATPISLLDRDTYMSQESHKITEPKRTPHTTATPPIKAVLICHHDLSTVIHSVVLSRNPFIIFDSSFIYSLIQVKAKLSSH